ncbi:MAG: RNA polymerase sigma factor [Pseudonocardia sp.]|nr:RNA polymerase sigma factor [Pseudonocardia sp.]
MADVANVSASSGHPTQAADHGLVQRLADGDAHAVGPLYDRYRRLTYSFAKHICGDDRGAEDAVREAFVTLWRDPRRFDPHRDDLLGWLLVAVHREAVGMLRRQSNERRRAVYVTGEREGWSALPGWDTGAGPAGTPGGHRVGEVFGRLPEEQRRALVLAFYGGFTQPEIAVLTGASVRAVGSSMLGAMRRLRRLLLPPRWAAADFVGQAR